MKPTDSAESGSAVSQSRASKLVDNLPAATSLTIAYLLGVLATYVGGFSAGILGASAIWFVLGAYQLGHHTGTKGPVE